MAAALKDWRIKCGLTVYRVSKILNIDAHSISRIEKAEDVHSSTLLDYLSFIHQSDPEWDIIKEWQKMIVLLRNEDIPE